MGDHIIIVKRKIKKKNHLNNIKNTKNDQKRKTLTTNLNLSRQLNQRVNFLILKIKIMKKILKIKYYKREKKKEQWLQLRNQSK